MPIIIWIVGSLWALAIVTSGAFLLVGSISYMVSLLGL
jgi:hypothetical protein